MRALMITLLMACAACEAKPAIRPEDPPHPTASASAAPSATPKPAMQERAVPAADRLLGCSDWSACAIDGEGTVRCRGRNDFGQLGTGGIVKAFVRTAAPVVGLDHARSIAVGNHHTCALVDDGSVWCWGAAYGGQLGDGTPVPDPDAPGPGPTSPKPVRVKGLAGKAIAIDAGTMHTCAVLESGAVACWGSGTEGQLGNAPATISTPALVPGVETAVEVACGAELSCARLRDGEVTCWGRVITKISGPTPVAGLCAKQITAGSSFGCAIDCDDHPVCWGLVPGRSGAGSDADISLAKVPGDIDKAVEIRGGYWHACMRLESGDLACWGGNDSGQLGQGKKPDWSQDFLDAAAPIKKTWKKTEAFCAGGMEAHGDGRHRRAASFVETGQTCARDDAGRFYCWGEPDLDYVPKPVKLGK